MTSVSTKKMLIRSFRVRRNDIGYIKWLLESHDGLATPTTRPDAPDILDMLVAPDFKAEFEDLMTAISKELTIEIVDLPDLPPLGG